MHTFDLTHESKLKRKRRKNVNAMNVECLSNLKSKNTAVRLNIILADIFILSEPDDQPTR